MAFISSFKTNRQRNFGGTNSALVADPLLSGYHFTKWILPNEGQFIQLGGTETVNSTYKAKANSAISPATILDICNLSITPPGGTLNKTEIQGMGGTKWSVATTVDYQTSLSAKFLEFSGMPVFSIIHSWIKYIRDNKTGLTYNTNTAATFKENYAGTLIYWTTKPDGKTVEYAAAYSGVFPLTDPQNLLQSDVATVDKVELDIEFNVDFVYHEDWVYRKAEEFSATYGSEILSFRNDNSRMDINEK